MSDVDMAAFKRRLEMAVDAKFGAGYGKSSRLARECNVSAQTSSKWLQGDIKPSPERLHRLAQVLEVSPSWLLGKDDQTPPSVQAYTSQEARELGRAAALLIPLLVRLDAVSDQEAMGKLFVKVLDLVRMQKNDHEIMGHVVNDLIERDMKK